MKETEQWLVNLVSGIVDHPEDVSVIAKQDDMGVLFTLKVNQKDAGKILGRQGITTKAIRKILSVKGFKHDMRAALRLDIPALPVSE